MVLWAQEELEEILQRTQSAWMYYSSEKDRLEKYFFMFEKSGSQNKKHVLKSGTIAQSKRDTSVTCDIQCRWQSLYPRAHRDPMLEYERSFLFRHIFCEVFLQNISYQFVLYLARIQSGS